MKLFVKALRHDSIFKEPFSNSDSDFLLIGIINAIKPVINSYTQLQNIGRFLKFLQTSKIKRFLNLEYC